MLGDPAETRTCNSCLGVEIVKIVISLVPPPSYNCTLMSYLPFISDKLIKEDWRLALACFFGPCTPYQYRIHGPGRWDGAKEAIATQWDRVAKPFKTRIAAGGKNNGLFWSFILIVFLAIVLKWLLGL